MNPPSTAVNNGCVVKECCAICWHGEYQDNMVLCAADSDDGALEHHEYNDVCGKFVVDPMLECTPVDSITHLVSYIKDLFPNGCADVPRCCDCVLDNAGGEDCPTEYYICEMLSSLESIAKGERW